MSEHVLTVLRAKRADISEQVHATEKKLTKLRAALANLDAAMAILTPEHPDHIPSRRKNRTGYFSRSELPRLVREALRKAGEPVSAARIADHAIEAKGIPPSAHAAVTDSVLTVLNILTRRGDVTKTGRTRDAKWALASNSIQDHPAA